MALLASQALLLLDMAAKTEGNFSLLLLLMFLFSSDGLDQRAYSTRGNITFLPVITTNGNQFPQLTSTTVERDANSEPEHVVNHCSGSHCCVNEEKYPYAILSHEVVHNNGCHGYD